MPIETITLDSDSDDDQARPVPPATATFKRAREAEPEVDSFDEDLRRAIAASLRTERASAENREGSGLSGASGSNGIASAEPVQPAALDRAQMERERLERQRKREEAGASKPAYTVRAAPKPVAVKTLADVTSNGNTTSSSSGSRVAGPSTSTSSADKTRIRYWNPTVVQIYNQYAPDPLSVKYNEILGPTNELEGVILSSYCHDFDFSLTPFLSLGVTTTVVLPKIPQNLPDLPNLHFVTPAAYTGGYGGGTGTMHTKCIILYFRTFIRIVIPTANLVDFDWELIENCAFVQDYPCFPPSSKITSPQANPTNTPFSSDLIRYLIELRVPHNSLAKFASYDFGGRPLAEPGTSVPVDYPQLVWSRWGSHQTYVAMNNGGGICRLATAVRSLGFEAEGDWSVELSGSSLGNYPVNWMGQFFAACRGVHPQDYFPGSLVPPGQVMDMKFVFPTLEYMDASKGGRGGGGTLFFSADWTSSTFPRDLFYQYLSKRPGVVSHAKFIVALRKPSRGDGKSATPFQGWIYVGSANPTQAAWGKLQTPRTPRSVNNNCELGVVIPIVAASLEEFDRAVSGMIPYKRPLVKYAASDVPWTQKIHLPRH